MTGYERCNAGEIRFDGESITGATPERVFGLGVGRTFQITRLFFRLTVLENILVATQRHEGWLRSVARRAGSAAERDRALEMLEFVGLAGLAHEPGRQPVLRAAQAARAGVAAGRRSRGAAARRADRGRQPDADRAAVRAHPRAEPRRQDVPRRRAQHGVRDGALPRGDRAPPGADARQRDARAGARQPGGARRLPRRRRRRRHDF